MQRQGGRRTSPRKRKRDGDHNGEGIEPYNENDSIGNPLQEELQSRSRSRDDGGEPQLIPKGSPIKGSHVIRPTPVSGDSAHSLPPPASSIPDTASDSTRTRSTSPVYKPEHLLMLQRPVWWRRVLHMKQLYDWMEGRNALPLLNKVQASLQEHYLPSQLGQVLEGKFYRPNDEDLYYGGNSHNCEHGSRRLFQPFVSDGNNNDDKSSSSRLDSLMQLVALESERRELQDIVTNSNRFRADLHAKPAWNDAVNYPLLKLAVRHSADVAVENVTGAKIARPFIPAIKRYIQLPSNDEMIDYALILRPPRDSGSTIADDDNRNRSLPERISRFIYQLSSPTFNQSTYSPLCECPTGVFIKTDSMKYREAQVQLGIWLASWFLRIELFPPPPLLPRQQQGQQQVGTVPSVLPVLIVDAGSWDLWFASREGTSFEVCGPLRLGDTRDIKDCYRLLAALRVLVSWMSLDFREWVESIV